jgi:hypothetical protein
VGERSEEALDAIIHQVQLTRSKWGVSAYQQEIAFYRDQDRDRRGRGLERAAAQAAHQRDSLQVAARQRTAAADPLLAASPATAYLNGHQNSTRALKTEPNEDGKTIGAVACGSLLSILYRLPEARQCYVYVDGAYGWMVEGDLVPTLGAANEVHQGNMGTRLAISPGFVSLRLQEQPVLAAVAPSALAGVVAARAAEKARVAAAYAKAHPIRASVVYNDIIYVEADELTHLDANYRIRLPYHALASCKLLRGVRVRRLDYELFRTVGASIILIPCEVCGYFKEDHQRVATAKATHPKANSGTAPAKPGTKPHK